MLKMENVSKIYRTGLVETRALRDFSLEVEEGEFVTITGPSGSGKTTFLNVAGLLEELDSGRYTFDGQDVSKLTDNQRSRIRNEKIGFIFQGFNLIPDLNIYDNVEAPLHYRRMAGTERKRRILGSLERVGLGSRMKHIPAQLSGGQQQRVAIARAIAGDPRTSRPAIWIPRCRTRSWSCCCRSTPRARPSSWLRTTRSSRSRRIARCTSSTGRSTRFTTSIR
jgi:putative ABC transport system ATP-binding protein